MPRKLADAHQCLCSQFVVENVEGGHLTTGCAQDTRRTFAPGHDARLAGFLATAATSHYEVTIGGEVTADALTMARNVLSPALAAKVQAAFDRDVARRLNSTPKADAPAVWAEEDQVAAQQKAQAAYYQELRRPTPRPVTRIKVGRWIYEAEINDDQTATYTDKQGTAHTTRTYTQIV